MFGYNGSIPNTLYDLGQVVFFFISSSSMLSSGAGESHLHSQTSPPLLAMTCPVAFSLSKALVGTFIKFDLHLLNVPKAPRF